MKRFFVRVFPILMVCVAVTACAENRQAFVPATQVPSFADGGSLTVSDHDVAMAATAEILSYHLMRPRTDFSRMVKQGETRVKYPADLVYKKGPVMKVAASFNIYVNCPSHGESCWGDPEGFQKNLTGSNFAALLTQYTKSPPRDYTLGGSFSAKYHTYTRLFYQNDLLVVLHAALVKNGKKAGYTNMYHIFLPKGTDTCFDRTRACYSPDHPRTNVFCAYHESVSFKDVPQPVIASVEPYQKVGFCASRASSGASALTNSTASTLAHEMFESITDPGPAFGWFNFTFGSEIGDLCQTLQWKFGVNGTVYSIQPMYSNHYHACANGP
ncbi:MAG: hypothetical protein JO078_09330 [Candidatus Eremiobacteraeota bacterium]|nr:hypothetical protein [Candidatus Eremiobacteraeota bacterium]MBV9700312.1 hypothetical protein [Candidatus Eremiobacteraeota bacterium]